MRYLRLLSRQYRSIYREREKELSTPPVCYGPAYLSVSFSLLALSVCVSPDEKSPGMSSKIQMQMYRVCRHSRLDEKQDGGCSLTRRLSSVELLFCEEEDRDVCC